MLFAMPSTEEVICIAVVLIALGFAIQYLLNPYLNRLGVRREEIERRKISEEEERKFREEIWKMAEERKKKK